MGQPIFRKENHRRAVGRDKEMAARGIIITWNAK
jgi:hypothetical protein